MRTEIWLFSEQQSLLGFTIAHVPTSYANFCSVVYF